MALSAGQNIEFQGNVNRVIGKLKSGVKYYKGALLVTDADGYLNISAGAATDIGAGVYTGFGISNYGDDFLTPSADTDAEIMKGKAWIPVSGAALTNVGLIYYLSTDDTLTATIGTNTVGYYVEAFKTGYLLIDFNNPVKAA